MRAIPKYLVLALVSAGFVAAAPARSGADMVTYTETVDATGTLGTSTTFSSTLLTLTFVGDTSTITSPSSGIYRNYTGMATVTVAGITATLTAPFDVFVNQTDGTAGIETYAKILTVEDPGLMGYDLASSIGPLSGTAGGDLNNPFGTSDGPLVITSLTSMATFQAVVSATVPEPPSLLLMGFGIAGMAATCLRLAAIKSKSAA